MTKRISQASRIEDMVQIFRLAFRDLGYDTVSPYLPGKKSAKPYSIISDPIYHPNPGRDEAFVLFGKHQAVHICHSQGDFVFFTYASKTAIPRNIGFEALHAKSNWSLEDSVASVHDVVPSVLSWCSQHVIPGNTHVNTVIAEHIRHQAEGMVASSTPSLSDYTSHLSWALRTGFLTRHGLETRMKGLMQTLLDSVR